MEKEISRITRFNVYFKGLCNFELDTCGWKDVSESESLAWKREMANITTEPGHDHTTGEPSGSYLLLVPLESLLFLFFVFCICLIFLVPFCWLHHQYVYMVVTVLWPWNMFDAGHLMYASGGSFSYTANMEYSIDKLAALGCQMRYFFQVYKP